MVVAQLAHGEVVGDDRAAEPEFAAQKVGQSGLCRSSA